MNSPRNKTFTLLMLGGIATCVALLPWSRWLADPDAKLSARVAEYAALRKEGDWVKTFSLYAAQDRKLVPLTTFLQLYGSSPLKVLDMAESEREIDIPNGTARVKLTIEAELQLEKLPAATRRSLGPQDPAQLRKKESYDSHWYWESGDWWLRMDPEAISRRSSDGKDIKPVSATTNDDKRAGG